MSIFKLSTSDNAFQKAFESCEFPVADFNHKNHVRLAYIYLAAMTLDQALPRFRQSILAFLDANNVDASKYHETLTLAWLKAVNHFMHSAGSCDSSENFIHDYSALLDSKIMLTHYSEDVLFSDEARSTFVQPDLEPIPEY